MARTGWGTTSSLRYAGAVVSGPPMSIACWYREETGAGAQRTIAGVFNSTQNSAGRQQISLNVNASANVYIKIGDNAGNTNATATGTVSLSTWAHVLGVYTSATSYACYRDGANKGTASTSRTPSGLDRTSAGIQDDQTPDQALVSTSLIAELAIWNAALGDADAAMLGAGFRPPLVRPDALVAYWPLIGAYGPEIELKGRQEMTIQGSLSAAAHPRIFYPPHRRLGTLIAGTPPSPGAAQPRLGLMGAGA